MVGLVLLVGLVSVFLPTRAQAIRVERVVAGRLVPDGLKGEAEPESTRPDGLDKALADAVVADATLEAEGATTGRTPASSSTPAASGTRPAGGLRTVVTPAPAGPSSCAGRGRQIDNDPYSPPCREWAGPDNGGSTAVGVTKTDIVVSVRIDGFLSGLTDALAKAAGARELREAPVVVERTLDALVEFFNRTYQFYGRRIRLEKFDGNGDLLKESLGGGQEGAEQDAIRVAQEFRAFADVSAISPVYSEALSRRHIVNIGAPYRSRSWHTAHRPYAWSALADCSTIADAVSSYYIRRLAGRPATLAGGELENRSRRVAMIAPDDESYARCASDAVSAIGAAGFGSDVVLDERYALDLNRMPSQAAALVPKIKAMGVTTIVCPCDPIMLVFLTSKVREQALEPEWINTGVAFSDQDLVGQLMDPGSWKRSFGISFAGPTVPLTGSLAYAAYKSIRSDEPSVVAELVYYQLQMLAIGIQMAGPDLTPETFEAGMFDYPPSTGRAGTWAFGPGDYATSEDAREIYWDPSASSFQNGERGVNVETMPGRRFRIGTWPSGDPAVPRH